MHFFMSNIKFNKEIALTLTLLAATLALFAGSLIVAVNEMYKSHNGFWGALSDTVFIGLIVVFAYGNFVYQLTRIGYFKRLKQITTNKKATAHTPLNQNHTLTVLVPSYKEESRTIEQTLWSAALLNYHKKNVVLLIDDPPFTHNPADDNKIDLTRDITKSIQQQLDEIASRFNFIYRNSAKKFAKGKANNKALKQVLANAYIELAEWLENCADTYPINDHVDMLFTDEVFYHPAKIYRKKALLLLEHPDLKLQDQRLLYELLRLASILTVKVTYFERKRYENLSHEPNKAMNINSYLSVMGKSFKIVQHGVMQRLEASEPEVADICFEDSTYVLTLDADSILNHNYADTLVRIMETKGNERIAVAQTPYSAIPRIDNHLERVAGITTDLQYIIHQGFGAYNAAFWVGANALLRKEALNSIAESIPGEDTVRQFVQDRTVIEDTESSIDLVNKGWQLYNHPKRLAYSATPDDYGSLIIQRRRWANGGLIILPKLIHYLFRKPSLKKIPEGFMRIHYLVSITTVNFGLLIALFLPLKNTGFSVLVPLTSLPYFFLYYRDMHSLNYSFKDFMGVYALNLLLIPINIAGVLKSIQQMITRRKIPFGRTPKINTRTAAQPLYCIAPLLLCCYLLYVGIVDLFSATYTIAVLILLNAAILSYGIVAFITIKASFQDIMYGIKSYQRLITSRLRPKEELKQSAVTK